MKKLLLLLAVVLSGTLTAPASAQSSSLATALDGLSKVEFGRESKLVIGDTIDVLDVSKPLERCINYELTDVLPDTTGALDSQLSLNFIKSSRDFENTFKFSYSAEASASATFAKIANAESSLKSFGKFENYLKRSSDSSLLIIEAFALHGRDMIREYSLKDEFSSLIDESKYDEFRDSCGTHFIRGWNRVSRVQVIIEISNIDKETKFLIENTLSGSLGGGISIEKIGVKAKSSFQNTISNALKLAESVGTVSARVETVGGTGIPSVAALGQLVGTAKLSEPENISAILTKLFDASSGFTYENSKPEAFVVVQHPQLSADNVEFNQVNFDKLGEVYRALIRVDERLSQYQDYKVKDIDLWERFFRVPSEELELVRSELVKLYTSCRSFGECSSPVPKSVDGLLLSDVLSTRDFSGRCFHTYRHTDELNGVVVEEFDYLSSIALVWKGTVNFFDSIDVDSTRIKYISPDFELISLPFDPTSKQRNIPKDDGTSARGFWEIHRAVVVPGEIRDGESISIDAIRSERRRVGQSVFVVEVETANGFTLQHVLGRPKMKNCPAYLSVD